MEEKKTTSAFRNSVWPLLKPFVNGGLAFVPSLAFTCFYIGFNPQRMAVFKQQVPFRLIGGGMNMATLVGSYELLTRKGEALNEGRPLSMYEQAGCGVVAGVIRACICYPLSFTPENYGLGHIFSSKRRMVRNEGILSLWRGGSHAVTAASLAHNMGLLLSYHPCWIYLKETYGLRENYARLGAGLFSGLCSAFGLIVFMHSGFNTQLVKLTISNSPRLMIFWMSLEAIRVAEESIGL